MTMMFNVLFLYPTTVTWQHLDGTLHSVPSRTQQFVKHLHALKIVCCFCLFHFLNVFFFLWLYYSEIIQSTFGVTNLMITKKKKPSRNWILLIQSTQNFWNLQNYTTVVTNIICCSDTTMRWQQSMLSGNSPMW